MICNTCGKENREECNFCVNCGSALPVRQPVAEPEVSAAQPAAEPVTQPVAQPVAQPVRVQPAAPRNRYVYMNQEPVIPSQYKPISAWGYFGYQLLYAIPLVGFILLIVFSLSDSNINRRNHARSYWCAMLVYLIIVVLLIILAVVFSASISAVLSDVYTM